MKKQSVYAVSSLVLIIALVIFALPKKLSKLPDTCAFCTEEVLKAQAFYEDDLVLALCTYKPLLPGHCLIIPKRHVERFEELLDEEMLQIGKVTQKVHKVAMKEFKAHSYVQFQKNGVEAGQTVPHVHVH